MVTVAAALTGLGAAPLLGALDKAVWVAPLAGALFGGGTFLMDLTRKRGAAPARRHEDRPVVSSPGSTVHPPPVAAPVIVPVQQSVTSSLVGGSVIQVGQMTGKATVGRR